MVARALKISSNRETRAQGWPGKPGCRRKHFEPPPFCFSRSRQHWVIAASQVQARLKHCCWRAGPRLLQSVPLPPILSFPHLLLGFRVAWPHHLALCIHYPAWAWLAGTACCTTARPPATRSKPPGCASALSPQTLKPVPRPARAQQQARARTARHSAHLVLKMAPPTPDLNRYFQHTWF